jgi:leader peptidase (prepilin peptidase) / N-methyltransferase
LTAVLFALLYSKFGFGLEMLVYSVLTSILIIEAFMDLETMLIADDLLIFGIIVGLAYSLYNGSFAQSLLGATSAFLFMFLLGEAFKRALNKEALGDGDIKMVIMMGVFLGIDKTFIAIFLGSIVGAMLSILLVLLRKLKKEAYIPFAPFLALGAFISIML